MNWEPVRLMYFAEYRCRLAFVNTVPGISLIQELPVGIVFHFTVIQIC